jgi:hypothetical protein
MWPNCTLGSLTSIASASNIPTVKNMSALLWRPVITGMREEPQIYRHIGNLLNAEYSIGIERFAGFYSIYRGAEKVCNRSMPQKRKFAKMRLRQLRKFREEVLQIAVNLILPVHLQGSHFTHLVRTTLAISALSACGRCWPALSRIRYLSRVAVQGRVKGPGELGGRSDARSLVSRPVRASAGRRRRPPAASTARGRPCP